MTTPTPVQTIRPARLDEADLLYALTAGSTLFWGCEPEFLDWEPQALEVTTEFLAGAIAYVLEEDGRVVGYYALTGQVPDLHVDKPFVEPDAIGTGRGKLLWNHAMATARTLGVTVMPFYADPNAAPFYRAVGAEWLGEETTSRPGWNLHRFRVAVPPK